MKRNVEKLIMEELRYDVKENVELKDMVKRIYSLNKNPLIELLDKVINEVEYE